MTAATPRTCPRCGASATKSVTHCRNCGWRQCKACRQPYNDQTPSVKEKPTSALLIWLSAGDGLLILCGLALVFTSLIGMD